MPFIYCTECGYKNAFTTRKAKFCAGCGQSLVKEEITSKSNASLPRSQSAQANLQQEDSPVKEIPDIQKLEYILDMPSKNPTIGDLINTQKEGSSEKPRRITKGSSRNLSREEAEEESMRECASSINRAIDS